MSPVPVEPVRLHLGSLLGATFLAATLAGCTLLATGQMPGASYWWPTGKEAETVTPTRDAGRVLPAQATTTEPAGESVDFIVKLKDVAAVDQAIKMCRRDLEEAQAMFGDWAAGDAVFSGMQLVGCSYSGELILRQALAAAPAGGERQVDGLLERIRGHENVAYADPDFTARVGLQE